METSFSVIYYSAQGPDNTEEFSIYVSSGQFNSFSYAHMQAQFLNISHTDKWGFMKLDMDIKREITELDLDSPILAEKKPINRFVILSGLVHVVAAAAILVNNHIPENETEKDVVEIQVASAVSEVSEMNSAPETAPVAEETAPAAPMAVEAPAATEEVVAAAPEPVKPVVQKPVAKPAPQATIDDIKTPTLNESPVVVKTEKPTEKLDTQDIDQELNKVDEQQLNAATTQIDEDTAKLEQSLEESSAAAAAQIKKQDEEAAAQVAARAEALRKEQAAAVAAAAAEAEKKAQAEEAVKLAAAQATTTAEGDGTGEKNAGPGPVSTEVRSLENLRQMPGNPKPQYDQAERLRGDKGLIVFQAFVTQDGRLTDFKLLQSTGHRNLDGKTLKALKQWKFYPGQEGWVELPFDWNLKGGPQEMPAYLRRKVGQGN